VRFATRKAKFCRTDVLCSENTPSRELADEAADGRRANVVAAAAAALGELDQIHIGLTSTSMPDGVALDRQALLYSSHTRL
jgi:hypothetical protein